MKLSRRRALNLIAGAAAAGAGRDAWIEALRAEGQDEGSVSSLEKDRKSVV